MDSCEGTAQHLIVMTVSLAIDLSALQEHLYRACRMDITRSILHKCFHWQSMQIC